MRSSMQPRKTLRAATLACAWLLPAGLAVAANVLNPAHRIPEPSHMPASPKALPTPTDRVDASKAVRPAASGQRWNPVESARNPFASDPNAAGQPADGEPGGPEPAIDGKKPAGFSMKLTDDQLAALAATRAKAAEVGEQTTEKALQSLREGKTFTIDQMARLHAELTNRAVPAMSEAGKAWALNMVDIGKKNKGAIEEAVRRQAEIATEYLNRR